MIDNILFLLKISILITLFGIIVVCKCFFYDSFKLAFNEFLDGIKYKSCQKCIAFDYHPNTGHFSKPCAKYTFDKFCAMHAYLKEISCDAYHFFRKKRVTHVASNIVAEVELNARKQYCERFNIESDLRHSKWINTLKDTISAGYIPNIDEEAKLKEERLYRVQYEEVCIQSLNLSLSRLSLDAGKLFETKKSVVHCKFTQIFS